jgi:hypothetical protein
MVTHRFDAIAAELSSLAAEIAAINAQPLDTRIYLRPDGLKVGNRDAPSDRATAALRRFSEAINRDL